MVDVGSALPDMELVDTELKPMKLSSTKGKTTVVAFFPGAFTGVCTKEMCTFRDSMAKMNSMNANVVAISVDGPFSNKAFRDANQLNFPILSDYKREAVRTFGVELQNFAHLNGYVAAKRAVFLVDKTGKVAYKWVSDDPTVEPNYEVLMSEVSKIK
jgi:glutaredoxin-dependent peroxiredoxin